MGTLAFLCTSLWFLLILDPCLSRRWPCDRPLESNVKMFWRWETIGKTHWENHWEKLKLNVIFWDLFFFGGGPFLNSAFKGVVADQNWKLPMTDLGANQFLARLRHFQTPLKRRTLSLMFLGIAKTVEHTKEKTSGVRRNVGSFLVWSWKLEDFWTSKTFILVVSRLYFSFLLPWFVPKVAMCFVAIFPWFRSDSGGCFFFFSKVGEVNARLDECSPLDVRICPPQHGDMYGNNPNLLKRQRGKLRCWLPWNWHVVFCWPESQHQRSFFFFRLLSRRGVGKWCQIAQMSYFETRSKPWEAVNVILTTWKLFDFEKTHQN